MRSMTELTVTDENDVEWRWDDTLGRWDLWISDGKNTLRIGLGFPAHTLEERLRNGKRGEKLAWDLIGKNLVTGLLADEAGV